MSDDTFWLVYLYNFAEDSEFQFVWAPVGIVEDRDTWKDWWRRVLDGEIELPAPYDAEGWWCSDRPVSFGLPEGESAAKTSTGTDHQEGDR